ncbi:MAG: AfsR/SARP family transcriptional regulator [Chloroflexota bacterium]
MDPIHISLFGSFQVRRRDTQVTHFRSDKVRALLAYLALEADRPHRRESLAGLLWPESSDQVARDNLRLALLRLRRALGEDSDSSASCLLVTAQTIQFNTQHRHTLDVSTFQELLAACETHAHRQSQACASCTRRLAQAAGLYRGPLLEGFFLDSQPFEEWLLVRRETLHVQMVAALHDLATYHERRRAYTEAERYARWLLALDPWQEQAHCQLMRILVHIGQRSTALAQYETCRRLLAAALDTQPCDDTRALYAKIEAGLPIEPAAPSPGDAGTPGLPGATKGLPGPLPPFIGRAAEVSQINDRLEDLNCRLLTIVGPGGIGKTRLALQAATEQAAAGTFAHGVHFIPVDGISSPGLLAPAVAVALGFSFSRQDASLAQLIGYLRSKNILLVLDSFEHLLRSECRSESRQVVYELLRHTSQLTLLVTSRERLDLQSEVLLRLDGMPQAEAVALFEERARRVQPEFGLAPDTRLPATQICRMLQGMPLAIELAAAWVRVLPCQEIARQIEDNLSVLTTTQQDVPERQRSLRATFDRSWELLSDGERQLFSSLAVFCGRFSLPAAGAVAGADLTRLAALVDRSLVRFHTSGDYELHQLLAQYAREKLRQVEAAYEAACDRHCRYYASLLQQNVAGLQGACTDPPSQAGQALVLAEIERQIDQLRAAWDWATRRQNDAQIGQMAAGLFHFYDMRSFFQEGAEAFARAAAALAHQPGRPAVLVYAQVLARQGWFDFHTGQHTLAVERLRDALNLSRQHQDLPEIVFCLNYLGAIERHRGNFSEARTCLQESLRLAAGTDEQRFNESIARNILGQVAYMEGRYSEARDLCHQGLTLKRAIGDRWGMVFSLTYLGLVAEALQEHSAAEKYFTESLVICRAIGDRRGMANSLRNLAEVAAAKANPDTARRHYQDSLALFREIGAHQAANECQQSLEKL